jgi:hypothetical protein
MTDANLQEENADLRRRLAEAEEAIRAIRSGAVDAFVAAAAHGNRVYTLESADRPYRLLVEQMVAGSRSGLGCLSSLAFWSWKNFVPGT